MSLLQPVSTIYKVELPRPLRINKPVSPAASSSSSPRQNRLTPPSKAKKELDLHKVDYPKPLHIRKPAYTTRLPSPLPQKYRCRLELSPPLRANKPVISAPLPSPSTPQQPRRLDLSIPLRPRLTPPSRERPVDSAHRESYQKTSRYTSLPHPPAHQLLIFLQPKPNTPPTRKPSLRIKRKFTHHITNEPATPSLTLGNDVCITTSSTPSPTTPKSRHLLFHPTSPFQDEKRLPIRSNFDLKNNTAILPTPLTQTPTLAKRRTILSIPQSAPPPKRRSTEIKKKLTVFRKTLPTLSPPSRRRQQQQQRQWRRWGKDPDASVLEDDLQAMDKKLRVTALEVARTAEEWKDYATCMSMSRGFGSFEDGARMALRGVLDSHEYVDGGVKREVVERGEEAKRNDLDTRDTVAEQFAATRGLVLNYLMSRGY